MIQFIVNHLWQSSCCVLFAAMLTFALRNNSPKVRYWVWLSASLKFLIPFALLVNIGSLLPRATQPQVIVPVPILTSTLVQISAPYSPAPRIPTQGSFDWVPLSIGAAWALGFLGITLARCRTWSRVRATLRAGKHIALPIPIPALIVPGVDEPGIVGFLRPALVLPAQLLDQLNPEQLGAILTHEMGHVRRRDNFFAAVHMLVEAVFWFNPLVWWIGARMVEERELACDEEVLQKGCEPTDYVEGILKVCRLCKEAPLPCVSGVTGADVKRRLRSILAGNISHELSVGRKLGLVAIGLATLAVPIVIGVLNMPQVYAQSSQPAVLPPAPTPEFEVATIKLTPEGYVGGTGLGGGPGLLTIRNYTLRQMMKYAYTLHPDQILSAPEWTDTIRYDVEAKLAQGVGGETNTKLMIQKLMADRFGLSFHRETRELSAYALTVANGGPKMRERKDGDGGPGYSQYFNGPRLPAKKTSMAQLAMGLQGLVLDRPVLDRTGLSGAYDFDLSWTPDELQFSGRGGTGLYVGDPNGPSIYTALEEQLGLKLSSVKAPVEVLIVDRVEKPSEN